ncbi:MAG: RsmE family RNA methyltransferase [Phycisphaerales bacterium]
MHVIYQPDLEPTATPGTHTITGEEAHHAARVKRLDAGAPVRLLNGRGLVAEARIAEVRKDRRHDWVVDVLVQSLHQAPRTPPEVHVVAGVPKGDRLEQMIDGLSQVGAASWSPLVSARSIVDPREGKIDRLKRVCEEALKQCGRPWLLEIGDRLPFADALSMAGRTLILAHASGVPFRPPAPGPVTLLIGPEGGFAPQEVDQATAAGAHVCSFGVHAMRVETAAVVAAGCLLSSMTS